MTLRCGDGAYFCQHPSFSKYQMANKYPEPIREILLFMFEGKDRALEYTMICFNIFLS